MREHTKEPWYASETDDGLIEIVNDERTAGEFVSIADVMTGFDGKIGIEQAANARRIVAAVNACEGMDTDSLESIAGRIAAKSALQMHANYVGNKAKSASLEEQRDKLLAALTEIAELDILKHHHAYAIAKGAIEEIEALKCSNS
jgi:hypothetical protein